jgi:hypothetical protein
MQNPKRALVVPSRDLEELIEKTRNFMRGAISPATVRAYKSDFADFARFCRDHNLASLPATPTTVALYISDCASVLANATITRRLTAITKAPQALGCKDSPPSSHHFVVSETLKGIRRTIGTAQHGKDALHTSDIRKMIEHCPTGLRGDAKKVKEVQMKLLRQGDERTNDRYGKSAPPLRQRARQVHINVSDLAMGEAVS